MNRKLDNPMAVILIFLICLFIFMTLYIKFLGSTEMGNLVERDGYCKTLHGKEWDYDEDKNRCYNKFPHKNKTPIIFTEKEFRITCPKNKFISWDFLSDCFKKGDSR